MIVKRILLRYNKNINGVCKTMKKLNYTIIKPYLYFSNIILFIFKIILFLLTKSFYFIISSFYNICVALAKKNVYLKKENYKRVGIYLVLASIWFIFYSVWIILFHKTSSYHMYVGIAIAAVTFADIGISIYGIVKSKNDKQNKVLKKVNLATALISLELTQTAILSFTNFGVDNSFYNGIVGIGVGFLSLMIGILILYEKDNK